MSPPLIGALLLCLFTAAAALAETAPATAHGVSFTTQKDEDSVQIRLTLPRTPTVTRFGTNNRIVFTFENTVTSTTLLGLLERRRGDCVEKFEIHMFRRGAAINSSGGIRYNTSPVDMLIVAYVESDIEAEALIEDETDVTLNFYRIGQEAVQNRPLPINTIENIELVRDGNRETITIDMTRSLTPSLYEELDPHRILLTFDNTIVSEKVLNEIHRFMETARLVRIEALNVGKLPRPYEQMDPTREYHFVGFPSPLAYNDFEERYFGLQSMDGVIALFPEPGVYFTVNRKGGSIYQITFTRQIILRERACTEYEVVHDEIPESLYPIEDEQGRHIFVPAGE